MPRLKSWPFRVSAVGILLIFVSYIIAGIIGNRSDALFILLWTYVLVPFYQQILKSMTVSSWPLLLILILLLVSLSCALYSVRKYSNALNIISEIATFDTILLDCFADLATAENQVQQEQKMKKILHVLLKNAMSSQAAEGYVFRASVLLRDSTNPEYLKIWAHSGMPSENIERTAFYIGEDKNKVRTEGGVAGETFKDGKLRIVHMGKKDDKWESEYASYIHFENRTFTPYQAFVSVPIVKVILDRLGRHQRETIGVVCFDSHHKRVFDSKKTQKLLKSFGERVGAVISIYWKLRDSHIKEVH